MAEHMRIWKLGTIGVIALATASATAQVAPPPGNEPDPDPEYVPVPPPAPRPQPIKQSDPNKRQVVIAPNIPFEALAEKNEDGTIRRLTRPPALLALANNPTIGENLRDKIMPVVYQRHIDVEDRVLANLDLFLGFEQGLLDALDNGEMGLEQLAQMTRALKPLSQDGDIAKDLEAAGIISPNQRALNDKIVREYKQEVADEIKLMHGANMGALFKNIIEGELIEPRFAYGLMVMELYQHPGAASRAGITAPGVADVNSLIAAGWPEDRRGQFDAVAKMKGALSRLPVDDHRSLLLASRELRDNPGVPPIPEVTLHIGGQISKIDPDTIRAKARRLDGTPQGLRDD